jgi:3-hydroxybutyrate dehydrogenase
MTSIPPRRRKSIAPKAPAPPKQRVALVTGASRGIGAAIARKLAGDGMRVAIVGRDRAALTAVADQIDAIPIISDVTAKGASEAILAGARAMLGEVDVVVANAGIEASFKLGDTTDAVWDELLSTNVTSVFRLCRAAIPAMVKRGSGRVVVVASNAGLLGYPYCSAYCASKHAVVGLVRAIAAEIARTPVTINAVCPGFVGTAMTERSAERLAERLGKKLDEAREILASTSPQRRLIAPEEVAHVVASLLAPEARGVHGQTISVDGGKTGG